MAAAKARRRLDAVVEQIAGFEAPAVAWEGSILPARLYDEPSLLDDACLAGRIAWARLGAPAPKPKSNGRRSVPLKSTPISLFPRKAAAVWARPPADEPPQVSARAAKVAAFIAENGASFFDEIVDGTHLLRTQVEEALAELVAAGQAISDSFGGLRALLTPPRHQRRRPNGARLAGAGRWALVKRKAANGAAKTGDAERVEVFRARSAAPLRRRVHANKSARRHGCRNGAFYCASIANSRRAVISAVDASSLAFQVSNSRCPRLWRLCVRSGGARRTIVLSRSPARIR